MLNHPLTIISGLLVGSLAVTGSLSLFWKIVKPNSAYFEVEDKHKSNQLVMRIIGIAIFALAIIWVNSQNKLNLAASHTAPKAIALTTSKTTVKQSPNSSKSKKVHVKSKSVKAHKRPINLKAPQK